MAEFQQWQKMVKGVNPVQITSVKPATAPQPAIELAKTTGDFFRSFRDISDGIKRDLSNVMDAPTKSATPIASVPATAQAPRISVKPQLSPEEMIEFEKWRQSVKGTSEQPK
jgi:thiamine monophosphate kinase